VRRLPEIPLGPGEVITLDDAQGVRIRARLGTAWISEEDDIKDHIVAPGDARIVVNQGRTVVTAPAGARISIEPSSGRLLQLRSATRASLGEQLPRRQGALRIEPDLVYRLMRHARQQRSMAMGSMLADIARFVISGVVSVFRPRADEREGALLEREILPRMKDEYGLLIPRPNLAKALGAAKVPDEASIWPIVALFLAASFLASWAAIALFSPI
jgi:hypothetical protein